MQDKTIINALLQLRKRLVRSGSDAAPHADALLALMGIDSASLPASFKSGVQVKRGDTKRAIIAALSEGPKRPVEVARYMCQAEPGLSYKAAEARVHPALARMREGGFVVKGRRTWQLVDSLSLLLVLRPSHDSANHPDRGKAGPDTIGPA